MGIYEERILPRVVDRLLGRPVDPTRARVAAGLSGEVLEIGFGSGRNLPHLPPSVTRLLAVDPAVVGRQLAADRLASSAVPVEFIGLDGQCLPIDDASVDHVLITWSLCTIPDVGRALTEVHRVLRPGGSLHFVEHGRSPKSSAARWQDRITPAWRRVAGGCHLNRPIPELVAAAGLTVQRLDSYTAGGPELVGRMFEGIATKEPVG